MYGPNDKKKLLFDCKEILRVFITPVFSGDVDTEINQIDYKYANEMLTRKMNKGIGLEKDLSDKDVKLVTEYESLRNRITNKSLLQAFWKTYDSLLGNSPTSKEGSTI